MRSFWFAVLAVLVSAAFARAAEERPINFANQIVPIFTKAGCNAGGCHGKASGQNGFKLSLFGFDADFDHSAIVKEARGRRIFAASPDQSLLLLKATGRMAHGGGKKLTDNSEDYRLLQRWIQAGAPASAGNVPQVVKLHVSP